MRHSSAAAALAVLALLSVAVGCQKSDKTTKTISVNVKIDETALEEAGVPVPEKYEVRLSNFSTGVTVDIETENGIATAEGLVPGLYSITASASQAKDGFTYTIAGSKSDVSLVEDGEEVSVAVSAVKEAALVFKEIYYTGCGDYYFRDQFYEIYNNSTEVAYADGLCSSTTLYANYDNTVVYEWPIENADQYVFVQTVWQIPGEGTTYPIYPGESIIIAQWGTNHKDESLSKGASPVDLSGAEFEAVEKESTTYNGIVLTDNVAINMKKVVEAGYATPQWLTSVSGARYVIFKPTEPLKNEDFITATNADYNGIGREVPISEIIDAVESVSDEAGMAFLGLPTVLDAGGIWCSGIYVAESISRKVKETREDGTAVYQDTNNTTNDFVVNTTPEVRRNGAKVPSWNTWIK